MRMEDTRVTPGELAAFASGVKHAADMALVTAITLEVRPDAHHVRQRAAIEALRGLAEALKASPPADGKSATVADIDDPKGTHETRTPETGQAETGKSASLADQRHAAVAAGYSGDACTSCQNFTLKRSGTCLVCETCGSTTGCS